MKLYIAQNMVKDLSKYKQYLLINEWNNIKDVIFHWVDEKVSKTNNKISDVIEVKKNEEPPLRVLWNLLWEKTFNVPVALLIIIFTCGLGIGKYIL